ncbi:hypothetical protein KQI08_03110 [Paraeggerthella hongkongensis]|uniref:hypothetical protein n=1 Tax=Paraeggerthella hominis TaxID=2897351 RepID=UPI001C0FF361|nr:MULTISPECIES: hypothetical protein [Paraeggerthella]MBU5404908.1 hypothetical protein [Paraeggerthella hongkongensis]MCD2433104.1 hypothetical protein [Paraeggerthella hominis]
MAERLMPRALGSVAATRVGSGHPVFTRFFPQCCVQRAYQGDVFDAIVRFAWS